MGPYDPTIVLNWVRGPLEIALYINGNWGYISYNPYFYGVITLLIAARGPTSWIFLGRDISIFFKGWNCFQQKSASPSPFVWTIFFGCHKLEGTKIFRLNRSSKTRWWFQIFFIFTPKIGEDDPIWRAYFSDGLVQPPTRKSVVFRLGKDHTLNHWTLMLVDGTPLTYPPQK